MTLAMVLGMFPTMGLADEVEVEPAGTDEVTVDTQGEEFEEEPAAVTQEATYNLWVGNVKVDMSHTSGNGRSYDADSKILTLNGYSNDGAVYKYGDPPAGAPEGTFMYSAAFTRIRI